MIINVSETVNLEGKGGQKRGMTQIYKREGTKFRSWIHEMDC